ncbi:ATPase [Candidatus Roizmanbacteria bacterium CG_4_10_14_0_8_um_filter_39_9]|uniref:ATPase n=1 Tax=Candidatus Roizmanbacteria bacterium CG_4_10_14_0_8_um_filter_39_9 TaxID=1974829 RepID=A0A2M7QCF2_9BACT|nr:MAG: ATPase [Candidatus Roizmanbacteria bacterium CG_4_10_14_0_8_um_filter_39_9]
MYIKRQVEAEIQKNLFKGDGIIIYGARQVGKTTLVKKILEEHHNLSTKYLNCDEGDIRTLFTRADTSIELKRIIGNSQLVVIDEAQRVLNIGLKLKLMIDEYPHQQIIATGSSSFDLSNEIKEPLTGRSREFWLYPLSASELFPIGDTLDLSRNLESLLVYGSYPKVYEAVSIEEKKIQIEKIALHYLYKDVLKFQTLKNADLVRKLLEALALQVGSEVSYNELSTILGVSRQTVESYVNILESAFVLYKVTPYSKNLRKEIGKLRKIYFYDLGVRNVLIDSLKPISLRNDIGALWENFVITEFKKRNNFIGNIQKLYYWRTYDGQEIDLIEEKEGNLYGYEIKWNKARKNAPKAWGVYKNASWRVITKDTFIPLQQSRPIV